MQTITFFHRTEDGDRDVWTPICARAVSVKLSRGAALGSQQRQQAKQSLAIVAAADMPKEITPGDYVVPYRTETGAFSGAPAAKIGALGGRQIEEITAHLYGSALDNYEVVLK